MVATPEAAPIFADAWNLYSSALQRLEAGDAGRCREGLGGYPEVHDCFDSLSYRRRS